MFLGPGTFHFEFALTWSPWSRVEVSVYTSGHKHLKYPGVCISVFLLIILLFLKKKYLFRVLSVSLLPSWITTWGPHSTPWAPYPMTWRFCAATPTWSWAITGTSSSVAITKSMKNYWRKAARCMWGIFPFIQLKSKYLSSLVDVVMSGMYLWAWIK